MWQDMTGSSGLLRNELTKRDLRLYGPRNLAQSKTSRRCRAPVMSKVTCGNDPSSMPRPTCQCGYLCRGHMCVHDVTAARLHKSADCLACTCRRYMRKCAQTRCHELRVSTDNEH